MKKMSTKAGTHETAQLALGEDMANVGQEDPEEDPAKAPKEAIKEVGEAVSQAGVTMTVLPSRSMGVTDLSLIHI